MKNLPVGTEGEKPVGADVQMTERKLAILLLDLIGSTAFVQKHGAKNAALHFQNHDRATRSLLFRFRGREIDRSDGFLCSFENVIDAVNFALIYQKTIPAKTGIGARIGIHWDVVVEVHQDDVWVAANAKRIELEGLAKNIAARTMSLCQAGQVLLTREAMTVIRFRTNKDTPPSTRYVCVGRYKFKGVWQPQEIYAVGETLECLKPPPDSEKAKRVSHSGIKVRWVNLTRKERMLIVYYKLSKLSVLVWIFIIYYYVLRYPFLRDVLGIKGFDWLDDLKVYLEALIQYLSKIQRNTK